MTLDKKMIEELDSWIEQVDFDSLEDSYIDLNVCDGGSMTFELFREDYHKEVEVVNYSGDDSNLASLRKVSRFLYAASDAIEK